MKKCVLTYFLNFLLVICPCLVFGQNWVSISVSGNMNKIDFNAQTGVVVGNNGVILKTIDGGLTYTSVNSGVTDNLVDVKYIGNSTFLACGWIWGNHGVLLKSVDNGDTWNTVLSLNGQFQELFGIFSFNSDSIFISGTNQIIKTYDCFVNYNVTNFTNGYQYRLNYFNNRIITMAHAGTVVFRKSIDMGSTYQSCIQQPTANSWRDMLIHNNTIYAIGYGNFCKSNDGDIWNMLTIPNIDFKSLSSVHNVLYTCSNNDVYEIDTLGNYNSIFTSSNTINSTGESETRLFAIGNNFIAFKDLCTMNIHNEIHEACGSYSWNGTTYTQSGQYTFLTTNSNGCDSTAILNLTINQPTTSTTSHASCSSFSWNGTTYTQSGQYTFQTTNVNGCDSTATLNLTINQPTSSASSQTECSSFSWNGTTYTQSGQYTFQTTNVNGCDSTATLNLTINQPTSSSTSQTACSSYSWNGTTYTQSGQYTFQTTNVNGCDSTATLNLTINQPTSSSTSQTECSSYSWNGTTYTQSGQYTFQTTNVNGCDSTATLNLTINQPTSATQNQSAIDNYTWPVNGQTYSLSGSYNAVIPNSVGCDSTITLNLTMNYTSLSDLKTNAIKLYPNPAKDFVTIELTNEMIGKQYLIFNELGQVVQTGRMTSNKVIIPIDKMVTGSYSLHIERCETISFNVMTE